MPGFIRLFFICFILTMSLSACTFDNNRLPVNSQDCPPDCLDQNPIFED